MKTPILLIFNLFFCITFGNLLFAQSILTYEVSSLIDIGAGADVCADVILINGTYSGGGTICQGALPVTMLSFIASVASKNSVRLEWSTEVELNNSGFELERRVTKNEEEWTKITFIAGSGTTTEPKQYSYEDKKLQTGSYRYRLKQIDFNGNFKYYDLENDMVIAPPITFSMSQNYPNPSNPKSKIDFQIPVDGKVTIRLYSLLGQEVVSIVNETKLAGYYSAEFDGTNLASGVYFYRIIVEGSFEKFSKTLKMILVK